MKQGNRIGLAAVLVCVFTPGLLADTITVFDFEDFPIATVTPFTDTVNGLQASYSSNFDPGGFGVGPSFGNFATIPGNVLDGLDENITLTIGFSAPQMGITVAFATGSESGQGIPFDLTAFNGASEVGSASVTGVIHPGFEFSEGVIGFSGPAFDSVVLSETLGSRFVIGDVTVVSAAPTVPEPSSLSLLAFVGFFGLGVSAITRLRRRRA